MILKGLLIFQGLLGTLLEYPNGGDEEDRTPDLRIANATLSQLSYAPTAACKFSTGNAGIGGQDWRGRLGMGENPCCEVH